MNHIAPPNWLTSCGLQPSEDVLAWDLCSLPADESELRDPTKWCRVCVLTLERDTAASRVRQLERAILGAQWQGPNHTCPFCMADRKHEADCPVTLVAD